jgi:hypothetical protein
MEEIIHFFIFLDSLSRTNKNSHSFFIPISCRPRVFLSVIAKNKKKTTKQKNHGTLQKTIFFEMSGGQTLNPGEGEFLALEKSCSLEN